MNKIKVGDVFLESNSLIAQTFRVNNLGDITTRQGGSSNNFTFPLTSINRKALGFPEDLNNTSRSPYRRIEASLFENNSFISKGVLKINKVTNTEIEATFFSDNARWFNAIKDKTLQDLDLRSFNHTYENTTIAGSFTNTEGFIYPLIDYGQFSLDSLEIPIRTNQMFPATYAKTVFEQIFKDINYEIEGELLDLFEYNKMVLPFSLGELINGESFIELNKQNFNLEDQTTAPGARYDFIKSPPTDTFQAPVSTNYQIDFNLRIRLTGAATSLVAFNLSGSLETVQLFTSILGTSFTQIQGTVFKEFPEGDVLELTSTVLSGDSVEVDGENSTISIRPSDFVLEGSEVDLASTLPPIKQSDFVKYIFNVFGIIATTDNLQQKVSFDLFNNVKGRIKNSPDWSNKIDINNARQIDFTELVSNYGNKSIFNYTEDSNDALAETYFKQNALRFGSGFFNIENEHITNEEEIYESPLSPFLNALSFSNQIYIPSIPIFERTQSNDLAFTSVINVAGNAGLVVSNSSNYSVNDKVNIIGNAIYQGAFTVQDVPDSTTIVINTSFVSNQSGIIRQLIFESQTEVEPKIGLIVTGLDVDELTGSEFSQIAIETSLVSSIPFCWFAKAPYTVNTDKFKQSLSFGDITFTSQSEGTLSQYWEEYRQLLSNVKYLTANFALNAADIANIDFKTPVYIDYFKSYFYINAVKEFTGSEQLTECELVRIPT